MKPTIKFINALVIALVIIATSCTETEIRPQKNPAEEEQISRPGISSNARVSGSFYEEFETGSKTAYAAANVTLATGSWFLSDALLGTSSSDRKTGSKSVRMRNTGILSMNSDLSTGASTVNIKHAVYGSDGSSNWELWISTNGGSSYSKVGSTITTSSTTLTNTSFALNFTGTVSFEIRKVSGGSNRINIDEFEVVAAGTSGGGGGGDTSNDNMAFGNPSGATAEVSNANNYLMVKTFYSISYNRSKATPNWVCWYAGSTSLGNTPRQDDFRADGALPSGWYQVQSNSYSGSGFDRGHNCPSGDRTTSVSANSSTFLMTNMIPQAPNNNQLTWANFENYTRTLVNSGSEVYVIMGGYGTGGTGTNGFATTINNGNITVPSRVWKVIVILSQGSDDVSRVTTATRVIAIDTPNSNSVNSNWGTYRTTVDAIESSTGYDLLSILPNAVESVLESTLDNGPTI